MVVQLKLSLALALFAAAGCADSAALDEGWKTSALMAGEDWRDQVIYQLMVDRFADGDPGNDQGVVPHALGRFQGGDWQGVIDHLDYLQELGVTALWISPVVRNLETDANFDSYHGYWQQDFDHTNPHFGDLAKLRELVQKAHARDLKVILDIVTNHIGQLFFYDINGNGLPDDEVYGAGCGVQPPMDMQGCPGGAVITHVTEFDPDYDPAGVRGYTSLGFSGPAEIYWFHVPGIVREPPLPEVFQNQGWYHRKGRITNYGEREQVLTGDFPGGLKDLYTEKPEVRAALLAEFAKWIQRADFDGFRIDTLKHVEHEFWQEFCPGIRQYAAGKVTLPDPTTGDPAATVKPLSMPKPNFFLFGESFDGDDVLDASYTLNQEVDAVFYFPQKFNVFDAVFKVGGPTTLIEQQLARKAQLYAATPNADGIGVPAQAALVNFLDNHDVPRFLFDKPSVPALRSALAFLLTEDGIPSLYYGTEQELAGGNDPNNRERLWDSGFVTSGPTFQYIQKLIALRKAYEPLRRGTITIRWSTTRTGVEQDAGMVAFERQSSGHTVLVVINTSDNKTSETSATTLGGGPMTTSFAAATELVDVLAPPGDPAARATVGAGGALTVPVPARGAKILVPSADVMALPAAAGPAVR